MENIFKKVYTKIEGNFLKNADARLLRVYAEAKASKNYSAQLEQEMVTMQSKNLAEWKTAIQLATDPDNPDRSYLRKLYENILLDNHLASVIDSRILFCQRSTFKIVNDNGDENEELTYLLERTWFEELVRLILMARFQGTTLIELFDIDKVTTELEQVNEIPLGHFNPKKGIITKTAGDSKGWLYKEGAMANYYLQVGKDNELGMLAQVAPIVLAKKLGVGAWLDFVEKYGVPPLFITTDREDDQRLNQLFEAAQNFKSNHFMVGRGNEKFEVPNISSNNPSGAFDPLIERANSEISKRFLGGTGLTDEKGFVGSVEIQFKLAKDRFESDKLMVKNIINKQVLPRLVKLSSVYSGFSTHYFEWDNAEIRTSKETAELVNILGTQFEIDPEWVEQQTGVPILGQKSPLTPEAGTPPNGVKKKVM